MISAEDFNTLRSAAQAGQDYDAIKQLLEATDWEIGAVASGARHRFKQSHVHRNQPKRRRRSALPAHSIYSTRNELGGGVEMHSF